MNNDLPDRMTPEPLIAELRRAGVEPKGRAYKCPWHDDKQASGSIFQGEDGAWRCKCHVCGVGGDVYDLRAKIDGKPLAEVLREAHGGQPQAVPAPKAGGNGKAWTPTPCPTAEAAIAATAQRIGATLAGCWTYPGDVAKVARFNRGTVDPKTGKADKTFRPYHRTEAGQWVELDPPGLWPLYRADEIPPDGPITVHEGEACADAAWGIGLPGVTSAHGGGSAAKTDWSKLAGREVFIVPDHDDTGRKYAREVTAILHGLNPPARVKIVALPDVPEKGDIQDWLAADGPAGAKTKEEAREWFLSLAASAPIETPTATAAATQDGQAAPRIIVPAFKSLGQLVSANPSLRRPVIHGLLRQGETANIIAPSKTGKSFLVGDLAMAMATGGKWLGMFDVEPGDVLILDNELHPETTAFRLPKIAEARGIPLDQVAERIYVEHLRGRLLDLDGLPLYFAKIEPGRFKIIMLDAWYRFMPEGHDENDNAMVSRAYNVLDAIADRLQSSFVLVHHSSKGSQAGKAITDIGAGAGAQSRAADAHIIARPHETDSHLTPAIVVEAAVRNWPRPPAFCLLWQFPCWHLAKDLDPTKIKSDRPRTPKKGVTETKDAGPKVDQTESFVAKYISKEPQVRAAITQAAVADGIPVSRAKDVLAAAEGRKLVFRWTGGSREPVRFATVAQPQLPSEEAEK